MLRLAAGIGIVATIYVHSPMRPQEGLTDDLSRWSLRTREEISASFSRSSLARDVAESAAKDLARELANGGRRAGTSETAPASKPHHSPAG